MAAGAMLAEEAARNASEAPRWVAVTVAAESGGSGCFAGDGDVPDAGGGAVVESDSAVAVATADMSPPAVESEPAAEAKVETPAEPPAETMAAFRTRLARRLRISVEAVQAEEKGSPTLVPQTQVAEEAAEEPVAVEQEDSPPLVGNPRTANPVRTRSGGGRRAGMATLRMQCSTTRSKLASCATGCGARKRGGGCRRRKWGLQSARR